MTSPENARQEVEPFQGVAALFNGDLHTTEPAWAPRTHWIVVGSDDIRHINHALLTDESCDGQTEIDLSAYDKRSDYLIDYHQRDEPQEL